MIESAIDLGVDGNKVVLTVDLKSMARIIEQRSIGAPQFLSETRECNAHPATIEIAAVDDLEAEATQLIGHVISIVATVTKQWALAYAAFPMTSATRPSA